MSQRVRLLIAMALALGILIVWGKLFPPRQVQEPPPETGQEKPAKPDAQEDGDSRLKAALLEEPIPATCTPPPAEPGKAATARGLDAPTYHAVEQDIEFRTEYLRVVLTTRGAALKSLEILPAEGPQYAMDIIDYEGEARGRLSLGLTDADEHIGETALYSVEERSDTKIVFASDWKDGWRLVRTYDFATGKEDSPYAFRMTLRFENREARRLRTAFTLNGSAGLTMADPFIPQVRGHVLELKDDGSVHLEKHDVGKVFDAPLKYEDRNIRLVAVTNKYFAAALIYAGDKPPVSDATLRPLVAAGEGGAKDVHENCVVPAMGYEIDLAASDGDRVRTHEMPFIFYAGPRQEADLGVLDRYNMTQLEVKMDWPIFGFLFGWFVEPFSKIIIINVLKAIYSVIGNYGVAIIALTLLLRLVMFPLSRKQQESMQKMQKLGPRMKALKEKFKGNKQKQNEEVMKLYKEHGVNPAAGCLPMLLQMPMFIGLFFTLRYAIDLRKAGFLYITDLSLPDGQSLGLHIDFTVPFFNWHFPYLNILPLLMMGVWTLQQALAPKSADPQQRQTQKIMMIMPIVFGLLLYNYAAGLALYMIGNMFFGLVEQHIVKKIVARQLSVEPTARAGRKQSAVSARKHGRR
ncbi:MAG: hypothetical protein DRP79_01860 [Planctomycetota bacterium]|nr:MAG: hypothetical protein DRP79_01860 [Planctomycetota bacterium]